MKKQISIKLLTFVISVLVILLIINSGLQFRTARNTQLTTALYTISQIEDILISNESSLETLTESLQDEYIIKAQMAAYIIENVEIDSVEDYANLCNLLNVDEIHIFDEDGNLYEGSEPQYFGYNFYSGEQMEFFLPMLEDKSLTLCQDITPNTAESKLMMYVAAWTNDGTNIVQIGLEPSRIIEKQSQNEFDYIFANMPARDNTVLFAIDNATDLIVGSSNEDLVGQDGTELGFDMADLSSDSTYFYANINGTDSMCVFTTYESTYIGVTIDMEVIYLSVISGLIVISGYFILAAIILYFALFRIINTTVLQSIDRLSEKVAQISEGDLDTQVNIESSPEFHQLSIQLNKMVSSLLNSTTQMSKVLDHVDAKIAVYEYKTHMQRVFSTRKLKELLDLPEKELELLLADKDLFEKKIQSIKSNTTSEKNIYKLREGAYLSIDSLSTEDGEYGVIVDVSEMTNQKIMLEYERDFDVLTELYNRRALYRELANVYSKPDLLKEAVIIALDMDNLKYINDTYGHDGGDAAIKHCAYLIKQINTEHKILSRLGGDEFIAVIYGETKRDTLEQVLELLVESFQDTSVMLGSETIAVRMSAGYVYCSDFDSSYDIINLLKHADEALYEAKKSGKSKFVEYIHN